MCSYSRSTFLPSASVESDLYAVPSGKPAENLPYSMNSCRIRKFMLRSIFTLSSWHDVRIWSMETMILNPDNSGNCNSRSRICNMQVIWKDHKWVKALAMLRLGNDRDLSWPPSVGASVCCQYKGLGDSVSKELAHDSNLILIFINWVRHCLAARADASVGSSFKTSIFSKTEGMDAAMVKRSCSGDGWWCWKGPVAHSSSAKNVALRETKASIIWEIGKQGYAIRMRFFIKITYQQWSYSNKERVLNACAERIWRRHSN